MIVKKGSIYYVVVKYKNNNEEWKKKWIRAGTSHRLRQLKTPINTDFFQYLPAFIFPYFSLIIRFFYPNFYPNCHFFASVIFLFSIRNFLLTYYYKNYCIYSH